MSAYACVMSAYAYASIHANPRKRACARAHTTRTHKHTNTHIYTHTPMQTRIFPTHANLCVGFSPETSAETKKQVTCEKQKKKVTCEVSWLAIESGCGPTPDGLGSIRMSTTILPALTLSTLKLAVSN